jgi:hypothetical protein
MLEKANYSIDAYKHYLKNDKSIPIYMLDRDIIFIKYVKKLIKYRENRNVEGLTLLQKEIANSKFPNRGWFSGKIKEILDPNVRINKKTALNSKISI